MAGIYIHIPFCKQACHYCDFHFSTSLKNKDAFLQALKKEIEIQKDYLGTKKISTVYFGGGTPSLLTESELMHIFETLNTYFEIDTKAEITLEANPDDLNLQKIRSLKHTPINRFSIGIQSFHDEDLKFMNRAHNAKEALSVVQMTQDAGFENITIDLIYGIPDLTNAKWKQNIQTAFELQVKHISAYCLTVESKTALANFITTGKVKDVDEKQSAEQFEILMEEMKNNNFQQYEISNYCKDDFFSRHNSNYWLKENYLGLGPSAHSFNGSNRQWNVSNNALYIQSIDKGGLNFEKEELTTEQRYNEYILTSIRTMWGTDLNYIKQNFGADFSEHCITEADSYIRSEHLTKKSSSDNSISGENLILTDKGKLFADKIASDLFMVD